MKLNKFLKEYGKVKDVKIIGKEFYTNDKLVEVIGFCRVGRTLQLLLIEYDEKRIEFEKQREEELYYDSAVTNRENESGKNHYEGVSDSIEKIIINDTAFSVCEAGVSRINLSDYENTLMIAKLFQSGWIPKNIGKIDIEDCFLCLIEFEGRFSKIPKFDENTSFRFVFRDDMKKRLVEEEIILDTTKEYSEKIYFTDKKTGEKHWIFINEVYVFDLYKDTMAKFDDPNFCGKVNAEELEELKIQAEKNILETCPKGKGLFCIEYESDLDMQVNFKSKKWLDSEVERKNSSSIFMARPDKKYGKNGNLLRADLIDQPVDLDTKIMEAEIFSVYKQFKNSDIKI